MGMFDDVEVEGIVCPKCGSLLRDFQTKDGPLGLVTLKPGFSIFYSENTILHAYDFCDDCWVWVDIYYSLIPIGGGRVLLSSEMI